MRSSCAADATAASSASTASSCTSSPSTTSRRRPPRSTPPPSRCGPTGLRERTRGSSESVQELKTLGRVGQAVSATLDVDRVLETIAVRANALARTDGCSIYEYDAATETFHLRVSQNLELVHGQSTTV